MSTSKKRFVAFFSLVMFFNTNLFSQDNLFDREQKANEYYRIGSIFKEHGLLDKAAKQFQNAYDVMSAPVEIEDERDIVKKKVRHPGEYIIELQDTLNIKVWENEDLSTTAIVRPDGMISFPLIDEVKAFSRTLAEVDEAITEKLKDYIRYPEVSVALAEMGGKKVIVLGEVGSPGVVSLGETRTLLETIAKAGGYSKNAVLRSVLVIKGGLKNPYPVRVNLARFLKRPNPDDNIILNSQDIVYVPETFLADLSHTMGLILGPLGQGQALDQNVKFYETLAGSKN